MTPGTSMNGTTEAEKKLDSMDRTLQEILKWTRFANISKIKETLENELDTDEKKLAYENSNGENTLKDLMPLCGAPYGTITNWWPRWYRMGIMTESESRKGRMKKIISLQDIGIPVPKVAKSSPVSEGAQPPQAAEPTSTETETT